MANISATFPKDTNLMSISGSALQYSKASQLLTISYLRERSYIRPFITAELGVISGRDNGNP